MSESRTETPAYVIEIKNNVSKRYYLNTMLVAADREPIFEFKESVYQALKFYNAEEAELTRKLHDEISLEPYESKVTKIMWPGRTFR